MWCTQCGKPVRAEARFCDHCGVAKQELENRTEPMGMPTQKLSLAILEIADEQEVELPFEGTFIIGRSDPNNPIDLELDTLDPYYYISRRHAGIHCRNGEYFLQDLGSRNGTYVNKRRLEVLEEVKLVDQNHIILGLVHIKFIYRS